MLKRLLHHQSLEGPLEAVEAPVFVVGAVRTGTTYLTQLLNGHPHLVLGTEDRLPRLLLDVLDIIDTPPGSVRYRDLSTDPEKVRQMGHEGVLGFHEQPDLHQAFRKLFESSFKKLIRDFYTGPRARALQQQLGVDKTEARRWGDKLGTFWPGDLVERHFGGSQFVHIIRDGRDVVVSMRSFAAKRPAAPWREFSFEQLCRSWMETTSRLRTQGGRISELRYREVRYEDLIANEQNALLSVFDFLGEDVEGLIRRNQRMRSRRTRELFEVHGTSASPVRSVGKWEKELTDEERAIAEKIMGELLEELARIMQEI